MRDALVFVGIGAIILASGWWYLSRRDVQVVTNPAPESTADTDTKAEPQSQGAAIGDENLVEFTCNGGKSITAVFERDIAGLTLSDGRQVVVRQAAGGTGIRYLSNDSKIEFRGEGNTGTLTENGKATFTGCIASN